MLTKQLNYIIFILLLFVLVLMKDQLHISTNLLSLFSSKNAVERLNIASELGYSKSILVVIPDFDKEAQNKVINISSELKEIKNILHIQHSIEPTDEIELFYKENYSLLANFQNNFLTQDEIRMKIQKLYNSQLNSILYQPINTNDPLGLFKLNNFSNGSLSYRGKYMSLGNFGYLIKIQTDVSASDMVKATSLYEDVQKILGKYQGVESFAPFYYTVENSSEIKKDVKWIVFFSTLLLLLIYYVLLKNMYLLLHTIVALSSSMIFATLVNTLVFDSFHILSLAFGMSITAVSIDYLLHYYFHGFYKNKQKLDKNVLYGYITTTVAFGIFSFIPIPLISQISFFTVVSLSFAYILFTFVFPKLDIKNYTCTNSEVVDKKRVSSKFIFLLSVLLLLYSIMNVSLDNNIRNLDYQNVKLQSLEKLFQDSSSNDLKPVIVKATSKRELMENLHTLNASLTRSYSLATFLMPYSGCVKKKITLNNYDFNRVKKIINNEADTIGFRKNYFDSAYDFASKIPTCDTSNTEIFKPYGLSIYVANGMYHTIAFVDSLQTAKEMSFVEDMDMKNIFVDLAKSMYQNLWLYSLLVISTVFTLVFISVKARFLYAINYIIFPFAVTLSILVSYTELNLMHIFSFIILIAIGIDYGIYMSNTNKEARTMIAIRYSILSTFAAFGVLIFSSILALHSIGVVISLGALVIFILIKVMK